jgi:hypothetical protein
MHSIVELMLRLLLSKGHLRTPPQQTHLDAQATLPHRFHSAAFILALQIMPPIWVRRKANPRLALRWPKSASQAICV